MGNVKESADWQGGQLALAVATGFKFLFENNYGQASNFRSKDL